MFDACQKSTGTGSRQDRVARCDNKELASQEPRHAAVSGKSDFRSGGTEFSGPREGLLRATAAVSNKESFWEARLVANRCMLLTAGRPKN